MFFTKYLFERFSTERISSKVFFTAISAVKLKSDDNETHGNEEIIICLIMFQTLLEQLYVG